MGEASAEGLEWLSDYIVSVLKSPAWVAPLAQFCDAYCGLFEDCEENKLEYTACHNEFRRLVDDLFLAHLLDVSVSPDQFQAFCQHGLASNEALHHLLVEQLLSVDNFLNFKAMMVKWNADLDRRAALELSQPEDPAAAQAAQAALAPGASAEVPLTLTHSSGQVGFAQWPVTEDVLAWHDRDFTYQGVPEEVLGAVLFAGPHDFVHSGTLTLVSPVTANVYLLYENSGPRRDGGLAERLKSQPEWVKVGGTQMYWGRWRGKYYWVSVWTRKAAAGAPVEIEVTEPWVGGIAIKPDTGDWRLYEEQEQLMRAIAASNQVAATEEVNAMVREADRKCEQAELEQAIALSLQAEEERQRLADQAAEAAAAASAAAAAAAEAPAAAAAAPPEPAAPAPEPVPPPEPVLPPEPCPAPVEEPEAAPTPVPEPAPVEQAPPPLAAPPEPEPAAPPPAPAPAMAPPAEAAQAAAVAAAAVAAAAAAAAPAAEAVPAADVEPPPPEAPKELRPAIPRMVKLQPLAAPPLVRPTPTAPDPAAVELRQRAERAIAAPAPASAAAAAAQPAAPAAPAAPTEEELRQRAEHLRRQRNLLVQKRAAEREATLREFQRGQGGGKASSAAVDRAMGLDAAQAAGAAAGLAPPGAGGAGAAPAADPGAADAAMRMRQALTLQLRQTLTGSASATTSALGEQISELEKMKAR